MKNQDIWDSNSDFVTQCFATPCSSIQYNVVHAVAVLLFRKETFD